MSKGVKQGCLLLAIVTAIYLFSRGGREPGPPRVEPAAPGQDAASLAIVEHFKSSVEPWAKDAMWSTANTLKIGVLNTGKSEDGHAQYACEILRERGFRGSYRIVIIDIARLVSDDKWVELGSARCNL